MKGNVIKYERDNIDTDVIIPGTYLKIHDYDELAKHAMEGLDPEFHSKVKDGDFLLAGKNFGCGSSREHAVWALQEWGAKAVIGTTFGSIFYGNCIRNGLLPIKLSSDDVQKLVRFVEEDPETNQITINLETLKISYGSSEIIFDFDKNNQILLLEGLDEIQRTLKLKNEISSFEEKHLGRNPWL